MKKLIVLFLLAVTIELPGQTLNSSSASHEKNEQVKWVVPPAVEQKFVLENPDVRAKWKKDGDAYQAQYVNPVNNMGYILVYDKDGKVLKREKELENQEYPAPINDFFLKTYPGEGYSVWSSTDSAGNLSFYSLRSTQVLRFDKNGNYLSPADPRLKSGDSLNSVIIR